MLNLHFNFNSNLRPKTGCFSANQSILDDFAGLQLNLQSQRIILFDKAILFEMIQPDDFL